MSRHAPEPEDLPSDQSVRAGQVLANKNDVAEHASVDKVIKALALSDITNREVSCYSISGGSPLVPYALTKAS